MPTAKVSFNVKNGVQKGPGTDASFITAMRRQQVMLVGATRMNDPKPQLVDNLKARGNDVNPTQVYMTKSLSLSFLKTY
jgi:hypothetical protein